MADSLTDKQREILDFIIEHLRDEGYAPSMREIGARFGIRSTNAVRDHLAALERKGAIQRRAGASRSISVSDDILDEGRGIPVIGRVAAGQPITAAENIEGRLDLDEAYGDPARLYALRVHGDSMIDAGIHDGDYVIVREQPAIDDNAIGVAIVDEEATVKRIRIRGDSALLVPENENYQTMEIDLGATPFRIGGRVVGVLRILRS